MNRETEAQKNYRGYLRGKHWRAKRLEALAYYGSVCGECGALHSLEVHHLRYKNLGHELLIDLIVLCAKCHARRHGYEVVHEVRNIKGQPLVAEYDRRFGPCKRLPIHRKKQKRKNKKAIHARQLLQRSTNLQRTEARKTERRCQNHSCFTVAELELFKKMRLEARENPEKIRRMKRRALLSGIS